MCVTVPFVDTCTSNAFFFRFRRLCQAMPSTKQNPHPLLPEERRQLTRAAPSSGAGQFESDIHHYSRDRVPHFTAHHFLRAPIAECGS